MSIKNTLSSVLFYQNPVDALQTYDGSTQMNGVPTEIFSCRGCNQNLAANNPASQYQRQKLIQKTVRVYSSLYTMNLAGLSTYQKPLNKYQTVEQDGTAYYAPPGVNWNQMSDRASPAIQHVKTGSGSTYGASSTKHTIVRHRPGAMSPGGIGVDIKHNSYDRYLNRLKGKKPLRKGVIPPTYGAPIPFNRAYPVYGGKVVKTGIINGCDCPDVNNVNADNIIYGPKSNATQDLIYSVKYTFHVGDYVWAQKTVSNATLYKAQIKSIINDVYTVEFEDGTIKTTDANNLSIYFDCNCSLSANQIPIINYIINDPTQANINSYGTSICSLINLAASGEIL
jgi:hypothetical protein